MYFSTIVSGLLPFLPYLVAASPAPAPAAPTRGPEPPAPAPITCSAYPKKEHPPPRLQKYLKITALINKLDNVTYDYFDRYWTECDTPLAKDCKTFTENVVKFQTTHNGPPYRDQVAALGYPLAPYDGQIDFYVEDLDAWQKVTSSDCWQGVRADAKTFTKWPYEFLYGYEVLGFDRTG